MILFCDTASQWKIIKDKCLEKIDEFLSSNCEIILGEFVDKFENNFSNWNGNRYGVGVSSGTDAIKISLKALGLSNRDSVVIQANTWMSTLVATLEVTNKFQIIDCDDNHQMNLSLLEESLFNNNHSVVIVAHMYGHCCDMQKLMELKSKYKFKLIEDCSQACGTLCYNQSKTGTFGDVSIFSLHPRKILGACGDAGVILTDNPIINQKCRYARNLGSDSRSKKKHITLGWNNRLDTIQSIILNEKIRFIDEWNVKKSEIAKKYSNNIKNKSIKTPETAEFCLFNSNYVYPLIVDERDHFVSHMKKLDIQTRIQYPVSIENLECFNFLNIPKNSHKTNFIFNHICSIPLHPFLEEGEVDHIINSINEFKV
jgi:hypothetical protein